MDDDSIKDDAVQGAPEEDGNVDKSMEEQPKLAVPEDTEEEGVLLPEAEEEEDQLGALLSDYFIEYASFVCRFRSIPDVDDGMKPVHRRILHCLYLADDGRFNRVASTIGDVAHYHPHGEQSILGGLIVLANKEYFIEKQGNFGNIFTGDPAAAARYIECRLTPLARETMFNPDLTTMVPTYNGRKEEPVQLPAKVPALLMLGTASGIAVTMSTTIFPHNFKELLEAQIAILEHRPFQCYPDFLQGGIMDASEYEDGAGRIRLRARIEAEGDKKIIIREIPATTTTESLIASIEAAAKKGKVKIQSIQDFTTDSIAIEITLARGIYAAETIRELYAYTDCEVSIKSNLLVIRDGKPARMTVSEVLHRNTEKLISYLHRETELSLERLETQFHAKTLAQIFIENRIYKRIESCETLEKIMDETRKGLEKFRDRLRRDITDDDIEKLLQIPIRRISLFDINKNETELAKIDEDIAMLRNRLENITDYAIEYIRGLLEKYGSLYPRRTEVMAFDVVKARDIARKDIKVYHDKVNHFVGTAVRSSSKDGAPIVCTEFDRLVLLRNDGSCRVISVCEREYIGPTKYVMLADRNQAYSILYRDKLTGVWYAKRFTLGQFLNNKDYHIVPPNCIIEELYVNTGVQLELKLKASNRRSYNSVPVDFNDPIFIRSREARGIKLTSYEVTDVVVTNRGVRPEKVDTVTDNDDAAGDDSGDSTSQTDGAPANAAPYIAREAAPSALGTSASSEPLQSVFVDPQTLDEPAQTTAEPATDTAAAAPEATAAKPSRKRAASTRAPKTVAKEPAPESAETTSIEKSAPVEESPVVEDEPVAEQVAALENTAPSAAEESVEAPAAEVKETATAPVEESQPVADSAEEELPEAKTRAERARRDLMKRRIDEDSPFFLE